MRFRTVVILALILSPLEAQAMGRLLRDGAGAESCFTRTYSAAHLARNPKQKTLSMRVAHRRETIPGSVGVDALVFLRLETVRRGDGRRWKATADCGFREQASQNTDPNSSGFGKLRNPAYPHEDAISCIATGEGLDSEGGDLLLEDVVGGVVVHINDSITMRTASTVNASKGRDLPFGGEDAVFSLDRAPNAACADLRKTLANKPLVFLAGLARYGTLLIYGFKLSQDSRRAAPSCGS